MWLAGSHVTRFIGLAMVGNTGKQRFLHALALVPAAEMDAATLAAKPANTTPSPYEGVATARKRPYEASIGDPSDEQVHPDACALHSIIACIIPGSYKWRL